VQVIKTLFRTKDISSVKQYLCNQWSKILQGRLKLGDFTFAKEVRLGSYSAKGMLPPAAIVATKALVADPRANPEHGERVPYVVVCGAPGSRLSDLVLSPRQFAAQPQLRLNVHYYLTKQIVPALDRILSLVGADPALWLAQMDRPALCAWGCVGPVSGSAKKTVDQYFLKANCLAFSVTIHPAAVFCLACSQTPVRGCLIFESKRRNASTQRANILAVCMECADAQGQDRIALACESLDCPIFAERLKTLRICADLDSLARRVYGNQPNLSW
jgi:DNA polymerase zeta